MKKIAKAKTGKSFGMLSVKAGIDKNPKPTAADRIAGAKMKAVGKAKNGAKVAAKKVVAKKPIRKAQTGKEVMKEYDLPEYTKSGKSLKRDVMTVGIGDKGRTFSVDTTNWRNQDKLPLMSKDQKTFKYNYKDSTGKVLNEGRLTSDPSAGTASMQVTNMLKMLEAGKFKKLPPQRNGGKVVAKKGVSAKKTSMGKCKYGC
jgi:hypothetical protein